MLRERWNNVIFLNSDLNMLLLLCKLMYIRKNYNTTVCVEKDCYIVLKNRYLYGII